MTGNAWRRILRLSFIPALCTMLIAPAQGQWTDTVAELQALTREREMLTSELEQYEKTLSVLQPDGTPPEQSSNPAVRTLARETVRINERIIAIAEREVTLLQQQIVAAQTIAERTKAEPAPAPEPEPEQTIESKPIRTSTRDFSAEQEKENVGRLFELLTNHYAEVQEAARTLPSDEEIEQRKAALEDAQTLARIPFNADKVRLTGEEGSTALTQITQRLSDPNLPESRRDIIPICSIKTRLFGSLIASESRSLNPVGKHHYVARIRLQPGDTSLNIQGDQWEVRLPQDVSATEYIITLYRPSGDRPELHIFSVDDLLATDNHHIPAWLPDDINLKPRAG